MPVLAVLPKLNPPAAGCVAVDCPPAAGAAPKLKPPAAAGAVADLFSVNGDDVADGPPKLNPPIKDNVFLCMSTYRFCYLVNCVVPNTVWIHLFSLVLIYVDCLKLAYSWIFDFVVLPISVYKAY